MGHRRDEGIGREIGQGDVRKTEGAGNGVEADRHIEVKTGRGGEVRCRLILWAPR